MSNLKNKMFNLNKIVMIGTLLLFNFLSLEINAQKFINGPDSYWIYKNLKNNHLDTLTVISSEHYRYQPSKGSGFVDLDLSKIKTSDSSYYLYNMKDYNIYTSFYKYDWFDCYGENFIYLEDSSSLCQTNAQFITKFDSLNIENKVYYNVKEVLIQKNKIEDNNNTIYYWVDSIGYIKKVVISELDTSVWVLTQYKLNPYMLTSYKNEIKESDIVMYPNPFFDNIFVKTQQTNLNLNIYDLNGKFLFASEMCNNMIDLSFLNKGVYVLLLSNTRKSINTIFKVIKQ